MIKYFIFALLLLFLFFSESQSTSLKKNKSKTNLCYYYDEYNQSHFEICVRGCQTQYTFLECTKKCCRCTEGCLELCTGALGYDQVTCVNICCDRTV